MALLIELKKGNNYLKELKKRSIFASAIGGMAEWSNAAVLKTVEGHTSGGSNPSSSAKETRNECCGFCVSSVERLRL